MNFTLGTWLCLLRGNTLALGFRLELQPEPGAQQGREEMSPDCPVPMASGSQRRTDKTKEIQF